MIFTVFEPRLSGSAMDEDNRMHCDQCDHRNVCFFLQIGFDKCNFISVNCVLKKTISSDATWRYRQDDAIDCAGRRSVD